MTAIPHLVEELEQEVHSPSTKASLKRTLAEVIQILRGDRLLSTEDVRERLSLGSINTVKRLARDGHLKGAVQSERGTWLIPLRAVVELEKDRERAQADSRSASKGIRIAKKRSSRLGG